MWSGRSRSCSPSPLSKQHCMSARACFTGGRGRRTVTSPACGERELGPPSSTGPHSRTPGTSGPAARRRSGAAAIRVAVVPHGPLVQVTVPRSVSHWALPTVHSPLPPSEPSPVGTPLPHDLHPQPPTSPPSLNPRPLHLLCSGEKGVHGEGGSRRGPPLW